MVAIKVTSFGGMIPATDDRLLPDNQATLCQNAWLYPGTITGMNSPTLIRALTDSAATKVFRIPTSFTDLLHLSQATWLEFQDIDTDVVKSSVVGDTYSRYYWVAPTTQAKYNTLTRITAGNTGANAPFKLGIPTPSSAPTVSPAGGAGAASTRSYVYTWVSAYGEEGPPSPATTVTGKVDDTWTITLAQAAAADLGTDRNLTKARIYRTVTDAAGVATYYLVQEVNIGIVTSADTHNGTTTIDNISATAIAYISVGFTVSGTNVPANTTVSTVGATSVTVNNASTGTATNNITFTPRYLDTLSDTTVSANSTLQSTNWSAPPTDLEGWVAMPNGMLAAFRANEVWFCEPYRYHAWPSQYALAVEFEIVGLGVVGNTLVVCTQSYPIAISGIHPAVMSQARMNTLEACMSRGSIISAPEGVWYISPNGLVVVGPDGSITNVTKHMLTKDKWQQINSPTTLRTLRAAKLGPYYYGFGIIQAGVFETTAFETTAFSQQDYTGALNGMLVDPLSQRVAYTELSNTTACTNVQNDAWTNEVFVIRSGNLYYINIADSNPTYETFKWKSKIFQTLYRKDLSVARVYFDVPASTPSQNANRNTTQPQATLASDQYGLVRVYADGDLKVTWELRSSPETIRIPSGFRANFWQFEIEARVKLLSFEAATSMKELTAV